jgi:transcriptional regulator with XRE-family HTH domain
MPAETFGKRVRERRMQEGLSQEDLAEKAEISRTYLSQIERGQATNLSWHVMERLSGVLGIKMNQEFNPSTPWEGMPPALLEFAQAEKLPPDDLVMLARLQYRGRQPTTVQQWRVLYNLIKAAIES